MKYGIFETGTIMENRTRKCPLPKDKVMKKKGRGKFVQRCHNPKKLVIVKWYENKCVCVSLVSSYVGADLWMKSNVIAGRVRRKLQYPAQKL